MTYCICGDRELDTWGVCVNCDGEATELSYLVEEAVLSRMDDGSVPDMHFSAHDIAEEVFPAYVGRTLTQADWDKADKEFNEVESYVEVHFENIGA